MTRYPQQNPEMFGADVMVIGDMGNVRPGVPTLTVALRGMANVIVEARTLASAKHSGLYGGAAPDALLALIRALATLHDERGDVAVDGLRREQWTGAGNAEQERPGGFQRVLNLIERLGNKVPHPAILFLALCVGVIVLSQILYLANVRITAEVVKGPPAVVQEEYVGGSVLPAEQLPTEPAPADSYHVAHETVRVQGLLTIGGIRYLFTSFVSNFMGFTAMGIILIVMIGVGVAEVDPVLRGLVPARHPLGNRHLRSWGTWPCYR